MKLHLPHSLRHALMAILTATVLQPLHAVTLSNPTVWQEGNMPNYTEEAYYSANGIQWNILEGTVANTGRIDISNSANVSNGGELTSVSSGLYYTRTISVTDSTLTNESSGLLSSYAVQTTTLSSTYSTAPTAALYASISNAGNSSTVTNAGKFATTAQGDDDIHGVYLSGSTLTNEAGSILQAQAISTGTDSTDFAQGITLGRYSYTSDFTTTYYGSTLNNSGNLTASARGNYLTYGICIEYSSTLNNAEGATLTAKAVSTTGSNSYGIWFNGTLNNDGTLIATAQTPSGNSYGIYAAGRLNNNATGILEAEGSSYGIYQSSGSITNESGGKISANGSTAIHLGSSTGLDNNGEITATGEAYGIYAHYSSTITNAAGGVITVQAINTDGSAYGILIGTASVSGEHKSATLTNSGALTATAKGTGWSRGIYLGTLINKAGGSVMAEGSSADIYAVQFFNSGTLQADTVQYGTLHLLNGSTSGARTTGGTLSIQDGTVGLGGAVTGTTVYPTAWGSTVKTGSNISISGGTLNVVDNVTLKMGGDLTVANDVTTTWNDYSLTIDNNAAVHSVSWKDELNGAWDGSMTLTHDGTSMTVTQQDVGSQVALRSGSVTIGGGTLQATERLEIGGGEAALNLTSAESTLSLHGEGGGAITGASISAERVQISAGADATMVVDSSTLSLDSGTSSLSNAVLSGSSRIESLNGAVLSLDDVSFEMNEAILTTGETTTLASGTTLQSEGYGTTYTLAENADVLNLTCSALDLVTVEGSLTLDFSSYAEAIEAEWLVITFGDSASSYAAFNLNDFSANLQLNGVLYDAVYVNAADFSDATTTTLYIRTASIPEPTTATLSLLALTALTARRRRK